VTHKQVLAGEGRIALLLESLGIDTPSFQRFVAWALAEHLVSTLSHDAQIESTFFSRPDALRSFRELLRRRTGRSWSHHDLEALFDRVKLERTQHTRQPIPYAEYLKLLWQVPLECAYCHRRPPDVKLHIDHIVPASRGGSSQRPNLQFLCTTDNLRKSNKREVTPPWLNLE
jgi:5-methylcytosine-specific restriction endonuclease McrA